MLTRRRFLAATALAVMGAADASAHHRPTHKPRTKTGLYPTASRLPTGSFYPTG